MKFLLVSAAITLALSGFSQEEKINQSDAQGRKQGKWEKYYDNGKVRYSGQFKNDKPVGTFFYYTETGSKSSEMTYIGEEGTKADARFFHLNGTVMGEGLYVNQKKEGTWMLYDDRAVLSAVEPYKNGKIEGTVVVYHLNGTVAAEIPYKNGLRNGPFTEYYQDGKPSIKCTYQDNTYDGEYVQFYLDGKTKEKGRYAAAVKDGLWVYYAEDGRIMAQQVYDKGKLVKEKFEEGFSSDNLQPVDIAPEDRIDESKILEDFYKQRVPGE